MADAARTEAVIQGVTAPMVAVPGPGQALMARSAGFGGTMPGMTAKIALRGGNQDAFRRWIANRNDVITANGLDQLMDNNQMPTLEAVGERFPGLSSEQKQAATERALQQYQGENTGASCSRPRAGTTRCITVAAAVISALCMSDEARCWRLEIVSMAPPLSMPTPPEIPLAVLLS